MNITSVVVSSAMLASLSPAVAQMSLQPFMAAKRSSNFSVAESTVVTYAAKAEKENTLSDVPDDCDLIDTENDSFTITCHEGTGQFKQSVSRSFRLNGEPGEPEESFPYSTPASYTHYHCPHHDPWGVVYFNETHLSGEHCVPVPLQSSYNYSQWDREDWLWDISGYGM